jgi:hypothetical protein
MHFGESSQRIKLGELIERGEGFERVAFKWVEADGAPPSLPAA